MRVKRYVVDSMPDALQRIRADLGKDAIIINTKNIKTGGFLGLFSKKQIEVIAAADVNKGSTPKPAPLMAKSEIMDTLPEQGVKKDFSKGQQVYDLKSVVTRKVSLMETEVPKVSPQQEDEPGSPFPLNQGSNGSKHTDLMILRQRLQEQEVEQHLIEQIISTVQTRYSSVLLQNEQSQIQHAKLVIEEILHSNQKKQNLIGNETRFVKFFGPTGVGKTTTIAKLAAEGVLKNKRKVGFITTDTYRIGAVDQLRTYANILNIPLEVVFQPKEMGEAIEKLSDCNLILMDTAGRNYRHKEYANELVKYFPNMEGAENYLVLSLTSKNKDMIEIVENFKPISIDKLIFTKADETTSYGSILNMVWRYRFSLSYLTTGQNVPDDIRVAAPGKITNLILGEDNYV